MSNIDKHSLAKDESVKTYYIHPAAFGSTQNHGYGHVPVVHADDFEKLRAKLEAAEKRIAELERDETQLIEERDSAEKALADMYEAAMGERPEWSNLFGYAEAIDDVAQHTNLLDLAAVTGKGE